MKSNSIPHSLKVAHKRLDAALKQASDEYKRNRRFGHPEVVCDAIDQFVREVARVNGAADELLRRARFIEDSCGAGTPYQSAFKGAPKNHRERLGDTCVHSQTLTELVELRRKLKRIVKYEGDTESGHAAWLNETISIVNEARHLEADGCYFLWYVHTESRSGAGEPSRYVRARIEEGGLGGRYLQPMRTAADSMLEWAQEPESPENPRGKISKKKRGGQRRYDLATDKKLVSDWQAAHRQGTTKKDFVRGRGKTLKYLERAQARERGQRNAKRK